MPILDDARLRELSFLTNLERAGGKIDYAPPDDFVERQMVARLLQETLLNDVGHYDLPRYLRDTIPDARERRDLDVALVLQGKQVSLGIGHRGRVRRAELEEMLRTGRDRDPTGLAIARKYVKRDLKIALLHASPDTPVSVAEIDMNGLKAINDETKSHAVGDAAIRSYLHTIVTNLEVGWDAYRGEGGDEVAVIMPATSSAAATQKFRAVLQQLQRETFEGGDGRTLSASCGLATTTSPGEDPAALLERADSAQFRAKDLSRTTQPRSTTIAVEENAAQVVPPAS